MNKKILGVVLLLLVVVGVVLTGNNQSKLSSGETVKAYMEALERGEPKEAQKYVSSFKMGKIKDYHGNTDKYFEMISRNAAKMELKSIKIIEEKERFKMEINNSIYPWASANVEICYRDGCAEAIYTLIRQDGMWKLYE